MIEIGIHNVHSIKKRTEKPRFSPIQIGIYLNIILKMKPKKRSGKEVIICIQIVTPTLRLPAIHRKMHTTLISRLHMMSREFMSLMKGRLLQLRRIRDFGGEELRFSCIRQRLTRSAAKCCMSSIRSEDRTTFAASGQSRFLPTNTEASGLKDRNLITEKEAFPWGKASWNAGFTAVWTGFSDERCSA